MRYKEWHCERERGIGRGGRQAGGWVDEEEVGGGRGRAKQKFVEKAVI